MPRWIDKDTKRVLNSVAAADLPKPKTSYIEEPDLSAITKPDGSLWPLKYRQIAGDVVSLMSQAERETVDAIELSDTRDATVNELDNLEGQSRATLLEIIDEFNRHSQRVNAILDAFDNANNFTTLKAAVALINNIPVRDFADLKAAVRNKLGS